MTEREQERAAIVKWLRERCAFAQAQPLWKWILFWWIILPGVSVAKLAANAIETGAHLSQDGEG